MIPSLHISYFLFISYFSKVLYPIRISAWIPCIDAIQIFCNAGGGGEENKWE